MRACGFTRLSTIRTVNFLIAGKLDFQAGVKDGMSIHTYIFGDGNGMDGIWAICGGGDAEEEVLDEADIISTATSFIKNDADFSESY